MPKLFTDLFEEDATTKPAEEGEADNLERVITLLDTLYESGEDCIHPDTGKTVTDAKYDEYRQRLAIVRPDSDLFLAVTASTIDSGVKKVLHDPPMTSISKANGTQEEKEDTLNKWIKDCGGDIGKFVISYKHDGVACSLYYEDGKLVSAGLRPRDGINGEDVTANARFVDGIPQVLEHNVTCSIRGELECFISVFGRINGTKELDERRFANPRNYTAGSIRQFKDPSKTRARCLTFTAYSVEGNDTIPYKTERERSLWCQRVGFHYIKFRNFSFAALAEMEEKASSLDYEVDGIVVSVNNLEDQEQFGRHGDRPTGNPKGKLAWKFKDEVARVIVRNIRWQAGRTGKITPVLEFDGVQLEGTNVTQCTAHNAGIVISHKIYAGTEIEIKKSGKIIPKFERVIRLPSDPDPGVFIIPNNCPACGEQTEIVKGNNATELFCRNKECTGAQIGTLNHYLFTIGVKGIAESTIGKLINGGLIKQKSDFYTLSLNKLLGIGLTDRISILTLARIAMIAGAEKIKSNTMLMDEVQKKKKAIIPIASFLAALGVTGAGKGTARTLVSHFSGDIDAIRNADVATLETIEDIGEKTAKILVDYFDKNKEEIDRLLEYVELELPKQGKFSGQTFVFTGGFEGGKKVWQKQVEDRGGKIGSSVSKKTDFLVVGEEPGSKLRKAEDIGVDRITPEELITMF